MVKNGHPEATEKKKKEKTKTFHQREKSSVK